ncbi:MAG: amidohydrolase [Clostridiales bacterium]|nr:amidohydrolase [Clostridiales bacterium]
MQALDRTQIISEVRAVLPEAIRLRRIIHENPEPGNREYKTSELIINTLEKLGFEITRPAGTSVCALLRGGKPGKTVAFRADMDALPIQEETGLPYSSKINGMMHACGHDMHMSGLLGAAMVLSRLRDSLPGNVKLFFQPDEEGYGGAKRMIEGGCMENPGVDAVFGAHISPKYPTGAIVFKYGTFYAAADIFRIIIKGKGCHGATPQEGIDPIAVGSQIVCAVQQVISRRISPLESAVITFGCFHSGTARNIIPDEAILDGVIRCLGNDARESTLKAFKEIVEGVAAAFGAKAIIEIPESYPGITNDNAMTEFAKNAVTSILGTECIRIADMPTMVTEDFGHFLNAAPGSFYEIGVAAPGYPYFPLHNAHLAPDESALENLIAAHCACAIAFLNENQ